MVLNLGMMEMVRMIILGMRCKIHWVLSLWTGGEISGRRLTCTIDFSSEQFMICLILQLRFASCAPS
jgi:hypothetical protein